MFCHFENANICWPSPRSRSRARGRSCPGCWRTVDGGLVDEGVASFPGSGSPASPCRSTRWGRSPKVNRLTPTSRPLSAPSAFNTRLIRPSDKHTHGSQVRHTSYDDRLPTFQTDYLKTKTPSRGQMSMKCKKSDRATMSVDAGVWLRAEQAGAGGIGIHSWENRDSLIKRYLIEQRCQIDTNQYLPIECAL